MSDETLSVFVSAALPGVVGRAEIGFRTGFIFNLFELLKPGTIVGSYRTDVMHIAFYERDDLSIELSGVPGTKLRDHIPLSRGELVVGHLRFPVPPRIEDLRLSQLASLNSIGATFRVALTM